MSDHSNLKVAIAQGNSRLARQVNQGEAKQYKSADKQQCDTILVRHPEPSADERKDDDKSRQNGRDDRACQRPVPHRGAQLETRQISPKVRFGRVIVGNGMQSMRPVDDAVDPSDQHRDKAGNGPEQERRGGHMAMMPLSWSIEGVAIDNISRSWPS